MKIRENNLLVLVKKRLPAKMFRIICALGSLAESQGVGAYVVGGFTRDIFLARENLDLDIVVESDAIKLAQQLNKTYSFSLRAHKRFSTAKLTFSDNSKIDIASARKEHYCHPAALPKIALGTVSEDLFRRDFTINTLAFSINTSSFGDVLDAFDGVRDLRKGKIRALHEKSFIDDPTRIIRAVRFEQRFDFSIEPHTLSLIKKALNKKMLQKLSRFRIGNELILILKEERPLKSLMRLSRLGALRAIHPKLNLRTSLKKYIKSVDGALHLFNKLYPQQKCEKWLLYFLIVTSEIPFTHIKKMCNSFSLSKKIAQKVAYFSKNYSHVLNILGESKFQTLPEVYECLRGFSSEGLCALFCMSESQRQKGRIKRYLANALNVEVQLTGKDLKSAHIKPGPQYRRIFKEILYAKMQGKIATKKDELRYLKQKMEML